MASDKIMKFIDEVKTLTVLELSELVKAIEDEFGVTAAAPVMVAAAGAAAPAEEEKSDFNVELTEVGENKMGVIKLVKDITGLGLKESKDLVDGAPKVLKEAVSKADADDMVKKFAEIGAKITLK